MGRSKFPSMMKYFQHGNTIVVQSHFVNRIVVERQNTPERLINISGSGHRRVLKLERWSANEGLRTDRARQFYRRSRD